MLTLILLVISQVLCIYCASYPTSYFEGVKGCKQYNTNDGYEYAHPYFLVNGFDNVKVTAQNVTQLRMGVLGNNDGHIRLSSKEFPYDNTEMNEIVLSGWANTKTVVRRYVRTSPQHRGQEYRLKEQSSNGLMSLYKPLMFRMEVHPSGHVKLIRDGHTQPFLDFTDGLLSANYIGFCNFENTPLVFFYDCPLDIDARSCEGDIVFN